MSTNLRQWLSIKIPPTAPVIWNKKKFMRDLSPTPARTPMTKSYVKTTV